MSTIVSSFVQDRVSLKQIPTASLITGAPKSWVRVDQRNTQAVQASFNVASIVDNGVGGTEVNLTAKVNTLLAAAIANCYINISGQDVSHSVPVTGDAAYRIASYNKATNVLVDEVNASALLLGDLL